MKAHFIPQHGQRKQEARGAVHPADKGRAKVRRQHLQGRQQEQQQDQRGRAHRECQITCRVARRWYTPFVFCPSL